MCLTLFLVMWFRLGPSITFETRIGVFCFVHNSEVIMVLSLYSTLYMQFKGKTVRSGMSKSRFEVFNHWTSVNTHPLAKGYSLETSISCGT